MRALRGWMIRHRAAHVLDHLLGCQRRSLVYDLVDEDVKAYEAVLADASLVPMSKMHALRRLLERAGQPHALGYVQEIPPGEKFLLFCVYVESLQAYVDAFAAQGVEVAAMHGLLSADARHALQMRLQDPSDPLMGIVGTYDTMAEGRTMTAANHVLLISEPWTDAIRVQAVARAFREGQTRFVHCRSLLARGTLAMDIHALIDEKGQRSRDVIDNEDLAKHNAATLRASIARASQVLAA